MPPPHPRPAAGPGRAEEAAAALRAGTPGALDRALGVARALGA